MFLFALKKLQVYERLSACDKMTGERRQAAFWVSIQVLQRAFDIDLEIDPMWCSWFVGFCDGESSFMLSDRKTYMTAVFQISLRNDDRTIIQEISSTLNCGKIYEDSKDTRRKRGERTNDAIAYRVFDISSLRLILIPLFDKYSLKTKKRRDYAVWREAVCLMYDRRGKNPSPYMVGLVKKLKETRRYRQSPQGQTANSTCAPQKTKEAQ